MIVYTSDKNASAQRKFKIAMKQQTLASSNFKGGQMIRMDRHRVHRKKILMHVCRRSPTSMGPHKRKAFPFSWLTKFDLLGFDEKRGTMHLIFILMKLLIKMVYKILVPPFHFLYPQLYLSRGTQKPQSKTSVDTLTSIHISFYSATSSCVMCVIDIMPLIWHLQTNGICTAYLIKSFL